MRADASFQVPCGRIQRGIQVSGAKGDSSEAPDFHDWLKAHAMNGGVPIQVVWPSTYDETKSLPKTQAKRTNGSSKMRRPAHGISI